MWVAIPNFVPSNQELMAQERVSLHISQAQV